MCNCLLYVAKEHPLKFSFMIHMLGRLSIGLHRNETESKDASLACWKTTVLTVSNRKLSYIYPIFRTFSGALMSLPVIGTYR